MNVSLTRDLEKFVHRKVSSGLYGSASEVVREGLRLLEEQDRLKRAYLDEVKTEIAGGLAQARAGELLSGHKVMEQILRTPPQRTKKRT